MEDQVGEGAGEVRWPRRLQLDEVRDVKAIDYEVCDLLATQRGERLLWNTEQAVWYTFTPETVADAESRRWVPNGKYGELAINQVSLFCREIVNLIDDRVDVIRGLEAQLEELGEEGEAERAALTRERRDLEAKRKLVETHRDRLNLAGILKTEPRQHVSLRELDGNPHLLNFLNGTYDVRTNQLKPHDPTDKITHLVPYRLRVDLIGEPLSQIAPTYWMMLNRAVGAPGERPRREHDEMVAALVRWLGYSLHGSNPEKLISIWKGASNIGKTQLVEIVCKLLGLQLAWPTASHKLITLVGDRHDSVTSPLAGKRVVLVNELHKNQHLDEHMVLQLVNPEGGGVELRLMRKDSFATDITWAITVTTNDLPQSDLPPQIQNRLLLFQLSDVSIPKSELDRSITARILTEEAESVLAGLVTEWRAWWLSSGEQVNGEGERARTGLIIPSATVESLEAYKQDNEGMHVTFMAERCEVDVTHTHKVSPPVLWRHCQAFFEDQFAGVDRKKWPGRNEFYAYLDKLPGIRVETKGRGAGKAPQRQWIHGLRLLEPDPGSREQRLAWAETIDRMTSDGSV